MSSGVTRAFHSFCLMHRSMRAIRKIEEGRGDLKAPLFNFEDINVNADSYRFLCPLSQKCNALPAIARDV
jgi:hypothetical protein